MNKLSLLLALAGLLGLSFLSAGIKDEFESRMMNAKSEEEARAAISAYVDRMSDVEDLRFLQNQWMNLDKAACQAYFEGRHKQEPQSPVYHYLWLRNLDDNAAQLKGGRELLAKAPDFYWGYRIFSATYASVLQNQEAPAELKKDVQKNLKPDLELLQQGLRNFPNDDYLNLAVFHHYSAQKDYPTAESYLMRLRDPAAIEANFQNVLDFIQASKRTRIFEVLFPHVVSRSIAKGELTAGDSLSYYQSYYLQALALAEDWKGMQSYFQHYPALQKSDSTLAPRITMHMGLKELDTALNLLEGAMASSAFKYPEVVDESSYDPLRALPRWEEVMSLAAVNWEKGRADRKAKALAARIGKPAPLWELEDPRGKFTRLEDLRGKIVVLDFWATWCGPCRKTLPLLDLWTKANKAEDIAVISINTWESPVDRDKVIAFMQDNNFAMTLLFGNSELPKAYGFSGIPYICILDQEGNIAYDLNGYSRELPELLDFWVEELRR